MVTLIPVCDNHVSKKSMRMPRVYFVGYCEENGSRTGHCSSTSTRTPAVMTNHIHPLSVTSLPIIQL